MVLPIGMASSNHTQPHPPGEAHDHYSGNSIGTIWEKGHIYASNALQPCKVWGFTSSPKDEHEACCGIGWLVLFKKNGELMDELMDEEFIFIATMWQDQSKSSSSTRSNARVFCSASHCFRCSLDVISPQLQLNASGQWMSMAPCSTNAAKQRDHSQSGERHFSTCSTYRVSKPFENQMRQRRSYS